MEVALESLCRPATGNSSKVKIKYASKRLQPNLSWLILIAGTLPVSYAIFSCIMFAFQASFSSNTDQHQSFESMRIIKTMQYAINSDMSQFVLKCLSMSLVWYFLHVRDLRQELDHSAAQTFKTSNVTRTFCASLTGEA